jgi:hypothetical protein
MTATIGELIRAACEAGVEVRNTARGLRLIVRSAVPAELFMELRSRKAELLAELRAHGRPGPAPGQHVADGARP